MPETELLCETRAACGASRVRIDGLGGYIRLLVVLIAGWSLLANSGCFSLKIWERRVPRLAKADPPLSLNATPEEILVRINQNAYSEYSPHGLKAYRCDDVRVRMQGIPAPMRASMVVEAPRNLRLRVANPLSGGEAVDIGSNEQEFWMWAKDSKPANVLVCAHDEIAIATQVTSLPLPFRPDWLMEVLGVTPISGSGYEVHRDKPKSPIAELVSVQHTPDQLPVRRIVKVNTMYGVVIEHRVESMAGETIAKATLSHHWRDPETRLILPRQIAIDWPADGQQLALTLELNTVDFNPPAESPVMWQVPNMPNSPKLDLGEFALKQLGRSREDTGPVRSKPPTQSASRGRATLDDNWDDPEVIEAPPIAEGLDSEESVDSLSPINRPIRSASADDSEDAFLESEGDSSQLQFFEEAPPAEDSSAARPFPTGM